MKVLEVVVHDTAMPPGVRDMLRQYEGVHEVNGLNGLKGPMPITVRFLIG